MNNENKTIVITGATSGIGLAAAKILCQSGMHVIGIGRNEERCRSAAEAVESSGEGSRGGGGKIRFFQADLSSQLHIKSLSRTLRDYILQEAGGSLDVLANNAGTFSDYYVLTPEGYELQFAVNHLAPFLLTHELLPVLRKSADARIITTSSGSHYGARINWDDLMLRRHYNYLRAYCQSKLANVLFTYEFNRRFRLDKGLHAYAFEPGLVNTAIGEKGTSGLVKWIWQKRRKNGINPEEGAQPLIKLATCEKAPSERDFYWNSHGPSIPDPAAFNCLNSARLWEFSERMCGLEVEMELSA